MARCLALLACSLLFWSSSADVNASSGASASAEVKGEVSVGGGAGVSVGGSAGGSASGNGQGSKREAPSREVRLSVAKLLAGCKEASCLGKAEEKLVSASLSVTAQKTFLNLFAMAAARGTAKEGAKGCTAGNKTQEEKRACFTSARAALGAATEALLGGNRTAEARAKVQKELAKEAAREALGEAYAGCVVGAAGAKATCLAQIRGDLAVAGLEGESPWNVRDSHFCKKMREAREARENGEDGGDSKEEEGCSSSCRQAAKQAAKDSGMEERQYASLKALADMRAAAEVYGSCQLAGSGESECMGMARADFVASSGARAEDFSAEMEARVRSLGEAIVNGVPVIMVRMKRFVAAVVGAASSCDAGVEDWFARTCLSRAKAKESRAESAEKRKCIVVDAKVQYSALVKVNVAEEEMEALSAHVASSFEGEALVAGGARRLGDSALRRLDTASESYASQDVAECSETDSACREGGASSETSATPKPSEPVAAAAGAGLGALAALASALALWQ